jgi:hypothetical protein
MNAALSTLLQESKAWIESQPTPASQTAHWYALNNFRSFIGGIESDSSPLGIERAVRALRHHIVDQFEWTESYCKDITGFCDRADRIRKQAVNG